GPEVLVQAMRDGVGLLTWRTDTFAYAESYDGTLGRYRGLRGGQLLSLSVDDSGLLVKPEVARRQLESETPIVVGASTGVSDFGTDEDESEAADSVGVTAASRPRRFHGTVRLDPARVGRDASRIADEVIAHLAGQVGAEIHVTLEV